MNAWPFVTSLYPGLQRGTTVFMSLVPVLCKFRAPRRDIPRRDLLEMSAITVMKQRCSERNLNPSGAGGAMSVPNMPLICAGDSVTRCQTQFLDPIKLEPKFTSDFLCEILLIAQGHTIYFIT